METLADFISRLNKDVGCYYHLIQAGYSIKKYNTNQRGRMGVFGWVFELKLTNRFRIDTYKELADEVNVSHLAVGQKENAHFQGGIDGVFFYIQRGSQGYDYKKAVTALNAIKEQIH